MGCRTASTPIARSRFIFLGFHIAPAQGRPGNVSRAGKPKVARLSALARRWRRRAPDRRQPCRKCDLRPPRLPARNRTTAPLSPATPCTYSIPPPLDFRLNEFGAVKFLRRTNPLEHPFPDFGGNVTTRRRFFLLLVVFFPHSSLVSLLARVPLSRILLAPGEKSRRR